MFKLIKRLGLLCLMVVAAYAGFRWGPGVFPAFERAMGWRAVAEESEGTVAPEPSAELADLLGDFAADPGRVEEMGKKMAAMAPERCVERIGELLTSFD